MRGVLALSVLCCCTLAATCTEVSSQKQPIAPRFGRAYAAKYMLTLPYMRRLQPGGLTYPVQVWYDGPQKRLRVDSYDGLQSSINNAGKDFSVYPNGDALQCYAWVAPSGLPQLGSDTATPINAPLPDLTRNWTFAGSTTLSKVLAAAAYAAAPAHKRNLSPDSAEATLVHKWTLVKGPANKRQSHYTFYVTSAGVPVQLVMSGRYLMDGSHDDDYVLDFISYKSGAPPASVFDKPRNVVCTELASNEAFPRLQQRQAAQVATLMPWTLLSIMEHGLTTSEHGMFNLGNGPETGAANDRRYFASKAATMVANWNAESTGYEVAYNGFAGLSQGEFRGRYLGLRQRTKEEAAVDEETSLGTFVPTTPPSQLPKHVDWSNTPASPVVKNQALCGSCWAFSTIGTIEGAFYVATGKTVSLSEQAMMDCTSAKGLNTYGCSGGTIQPAFEYVKRNKGVTASKDHRYYGEDMFCSKNATRKGAEPIASNIKGYISVQPHNNTALMEALWKHGPLSVAMDASQDTFRYYNKGVYYDKWCWQEEGMMDHAVVLVGYGTEDGKDYWLMRNSWSTRWGDNGHFKIARKGAKFVTDCGITSQPILAVVDAGSSSKRKYPLIFKKGTKTVTLR